MGVYSREMLHGPRARASRRRASHFVTGSHRFLRSFGERLPHNARRFLLGRRARRDRRISFTGLNQRLPHALAAPCGNYLPRSVRADGRILDARVPRSDLPEQARDAAARSDRIIAVSHFTARQVVDLLGVEAARVRVVHHGVRPAAMPDGRA